MAAAQGTSKYNRHSDAVDEDICREPCSEHEGEVIKYHCLNHDVLGCSVCITLEHRTCNKVNYIPKVAKDLFNDKTFLDIDSDFKSAKYKSTLLNELASQKSTLYKTSSDSAIENFKIYKKDIIKALNNIESELEHKTISLKQEELNAMSKLLNKVEQPQDTLKKMTDKVYQLKTENQNCSLYTYMVQIRNLLHPLEDTMDEVSDSLSIRKSLIKFTPNNDILNNLETSAGFGKITVEHDTILRGEHLKDISIGLTEDMKCMITGSTILPSNKLVIADHHNDNLKLVDPESGQVKLFLKLSSQPWDIVLIDDSQLAVTLPYKMQIAFVSQTTTPIVEKYLDVKGKCLGADYRDNKLAVSYSGPDKVEVLTLQGTVLHNIPNRGTLFRGYIFNDPHYISIGQDTKSLYVTNFNNSNVVCLKLDGTVKYSYTDKQLERPFKIISDSGGRLYVCDRGSDTVHQLSRDLQKIKLLLSREDGLNYPCTICCNKINTEVYIGGSSNTLNVYK